MKPKSLLIAKLAGALALSVIAGGAAGRANSGGGVNPALIVAPGAGPVSATEAQKRADFVLYLPTYLPGGAGPPRLLFGPEQRLADTYVPNRVYATYGRGIALWQMPTIGRPLRHPAWPVDLGGRMGWASDGPGSGRATVEWRQGETQLGVSGPLPIQELFKIAGSAVQAAPQVPMAAPSVARLQHWAPETPPNLPEGGVGVILRPGIPPTVASVDPGGPAADAGVQPGDVIAAVDGRPVVAVPIAATMRLVRGTPGTTVHITLHRGDFVAPVEVALRREPLPTLHVQEVTLAQARSMLPFTFLEPGWLPPRCRLLTCAVMTRNGKPWEAQLVYHIVGRPLLLIGESRASARHLPLASGKGTERVRIGGATGMLGLSAGTLSWVQRGTAISLQSSSLQRDLALKIARSMK